VSITRRRLLELAGLAVGAVALNGVPLEGAAPAVLDETLQPGDIFTIVGRYALNPITRKSTGQLQQFIVTGVSGDGEISLHPKRALDD
jgi:hypothetical protein